MLLKSMHIVRFEHEICLTFSSNNQRPLMEAENLLNLFNSYWFEHEILSTQAHPQNTEPTNPSHETLEIPSPSLPTISTRSMEELVSSSISSFSPSPNSVLPTRALQPILSGKEMEQVVQAEDLEHSRTRKKVSEAERNGEKRKKLQRGLSKSLSDLEFEEIRGFMELGFVFSEDDKRSQFLATILPGLQRLGLETKKGDEEDGSGISRPYLSEAWDFSERNKMRRRRENPPLTMSWGEIPIPSVSSKIDMKGYLRSWAHTVASSVK